MKLKYTLLIAALAATPALAVDIYGSDGTYLGNLGGSQFDYNSTNNKFGPYGSPYGNPINNPYGKYGSPYSSESPNNPYSVPSYDYGYDGGYGGYGDYDY